MIVRLLLFAIVLMTTSLYGRVRKETDLFAGNIIAFSGQNIGPGEFYIQSYFYASRQRGVYNDHSTLISDRNVHQNQLELEFVLGLTNTIDITLEVNGFNIHNNGRSTNHFGDTNLFLGFQVLEENRYQPDIRFFVGEYFPTGKYEGLDEQFRGADGVGAGAFSTYLTFIASKTYAWKHPFRWTLNLFYIFSSQVNVKGRNTYINDPNARGTVFPGIQFEADLAFEYKFNRPWGCGLDIYFQQQNSSSFRNRSPTATITDIPSTHLLSLVPTIEYNWSQKMNMLAAWWFTVTGRNATAFNSFVFSFFYEF